MSPIAWEILVFGIGGAVVLRYIVTSAAPVPTLDPSYNAAGPVFGPVFGDRRSVTTTTWKRNPNGTWSLA